MTIKPIRNDEDLHAAFKQLELVFQAPEGTPQADEREVLVTLIEAHEQKHYPDAHQRAPHLRHRRHRRPADAGAQGGA